MSRIMGEKSRVEGAGALGESAGRGRRLLIGLAVAVGLMALAPVAAQAADGLSNQNTNNTTLNGQTLNFGSPIQANLPSTVTIYLWSNSASGGLFNLSTRTITANINLSNTNYIRSGGNCSGSTGSSSFSASYSYQGGASFRSCSIILSLRAGTPPGTQNGTLTYSGVGNGSANLVGTVIATNNSGVIQNTAGNQAVTSYDYGTVGIGFTSSYTFTLRNNGNMPLTTANSQSIVGANAAEFSRTTNCPATLAVGATCTITVNYAPTTEGVKDAQLRVSTGNAGVLAVDLEAAALIPTYIPELQNAAGTEPVEEHTFPGPIGTGDPSGPTYTFTLRNLGNAPLTGANNRAITGPDADQFTSTSNCPASLGSNQTCTITVRFSPTTPGAKEAVLEVNTTNGGSDTVALHGTAEAAVVELTIQNTAGTDQVTGNAFPDTAALGNRSYTFTLRNTGNTSLTGMNNQALTGDDADQFASSTNCPAVLAPYTSCTATVTFAPTRIEDGMAATFQVSPTNADPESVSLSGDAITPTPQLSIRNTGDTADVSAHGFSANVASSQAYTFTIKNTGDSALGGINNQTVTGFNPGDFARTTTCGATLAPGASCTTTVTFNPSRAGLRRAVLTVTPTNPFVTPAVRTVELTGQGTGLRVMNDVTDNMTAIGSQKRWLDTLSLAPGGSLASDQVRVSFEVDLGEANSVSGVDIANVITTNDTVPNAGFSNIADLIGGRVDVQRKPGSTQALVTASVPLNMTPMGTDGGSYGFSNGTYIEVFGVVVGCTGGDYTSDDRRVWFRVRGSDGSTSQVVGSVVRFSNQNYGCPDSQGPSLAGPRVLSVGGDNLPSGTFVAEADKNESATFQFTTRARTAGLLNGAGTVDGVNWRIRNAKTGDMFRLVNGSYQACADPCTADSNFTAGGRVNFASNAAGTQTLTIPGIPSRGRWIVEAAGQGTDEDDNRFWGIGVLRINDRSGDSPTMTFGGTLGARPDTDTEYTVTANVADPADPVNTFDAQGGRVQVVEWDLDGNPSNGPAGDGFEVRTEGDSSTNLTAAERTVTFDTTGKQPGPYTIRARITDNGSTMASDSDAISRIYEYTTTINSLPQPVSETVYLEADDPQGSELDFRATDADGDPYRVSISPNPANTGSLGGDLDGPIGDNSKAYSWPADYTGTDTFAFTPTDDRNGTGEQGTLTVVVRPNTTIDASTIAGTLFHADPGENYLGATTTTSANFEFSSPQSPVVAYQCRHLNDGEVVDNWSACSSESTGDIELSGLQDGLHRLEVRAVNAEGDADGTPAFVTWRVDNTSPVTEVLEGPVSDLPNQQPRQTSDTSPSYRFRATAAERSLQEHVTYECRVMFGPMEGQWIPCGSPSDSEGSARVDILGDEPGFGLGTDPLPEGTYVIEVRATDEVGNLGPVMTETFIVDVSPPETALASGPEGLVNTRDLEYVLSSSEGQSTFECEVVGEDVGVVVPMGPCPGPAADGSRPTFTVPADDVYTLTAIATDPATNPDPTPLVVEFEVDATEPETTMEPEVDFGDGPTTERRTRSRKVDVTFTGEDARQMSGFQCRLDSDDEDAWTLCQSPERFGGLSDGPHTLEVRARDEAGNFDSTPEVLEWVVDLTPPETTITVHPDPVTSDDEPTFEFEADEEIESATCVLDGGAPVPCDSPVDLAELGAAGPLSDGQHQLTVRSTDIAGNVETTPATVSWQQDTTVPVVELLGSPGEFTPLGDADFGWVVRDGSPLAASPEAQSQCALDPADPDAIAEEEWVDCDRTFTVAEADNVNGPHTFSVRAVDAAGNVSEVVRHQWTVLGEKPVAPTVDDSNPGDGDTTRVTNAYFAFSHPLEGTAGLAGLFCQLDGGSWNPCEGNYGAENLSDGPHTFRVVARDVAGNQSEAATVGWTVQSNAPVTTIDFGPNGLTKERSARIEFSSDRAGTFECRIDGAAWEACESPLELADLPDGQHSVSVRAVSSAAPVGVKDPTPPTRQWTVDGTAPSVTIDEAPTGSVASPNATVRFSSDDESASFQCQIGDGLYDSCESPLELTGLPKGAVTVNVRAVDAAGNVSESPAQAVWYVECPVGFEGAPPNCTKIPPVEGPGIRARLTEGTLALPLGSVPLPADQLTMTGKRGANGRWFVPRDGVSFQPVNQQIPDFPVPGASVDIEISISATGDGWGMLPSGGGPAEFFVPVRADIQAMLGPIPAVPEGVECALKPVNFDLTGTYDEAARTVTLGATNIHFPQITGCADLKSIVDEQLALPRDDIELSMTLALEDFTEPCPAGTAGTPPDCRKVEEPGPGPELGANLGAAVVKAPKKVKAGKRLTVTARIANDGDAAATGVPVCLKTPKRLIAGKASRCVTIASIGPKGTGIARFKLKAKKVKRKSKAMLTITAPTGDGTSKRDYRGHVTVLR